MHEINIRSYNHETDFHQVTSNLQQAGLYDKRRDTELLLGRTAQERPGGILVASLGKVVVGNVFVGDIYPLISGLAVDPAYRLQGIGKKLGLAAEEQLRARGHTYAEALIDFDRDDLRALYEAHGFRVVYSCQGMVKFFDPFKPISSGLIRGSEILSPDQRNFQLVYAYCQPRFPGATFFQDKPDVLNRYFKGFGAPLCNLDIETGGSPRNLVEVAASPVKIEQLPSADLWANRWVRYKVRPGSEYDLLGQVVHEYTGPDPNCRVLDRERVYVARHKETGQLIPFETTNTQMGKIRDPADGDGGSKVMRDLEEVARECRYDALDYGLT